jgi:hypothetical protein
VGDRVFHGEAALEDAADALRGMRAA